MRKYIFVCCLVLFSPLCFSGEWYIVGSGKSEAKIDTAMLEVKLWKFLDAESKATFMPKEIYKFQYKFVDKNEIYINALCVSRAAVDDIGALPDFTSEQLTKDFIDVFDGGSCFFGVKFNIKRNKFSELRINGHA